MRYALHTTDLGLLQTLGSWFTRAAERRRLRRLDGALLKDLGFTPGDVEREAAKPFWQA